MKKDERKAPLRPFSTGRLNVSQGDPSPSSFLQDAFSLVLPRTQRQLSPGTDTEEKTASERDVLALKRASRQLGAGSFRYSRLSIHLKTSQLKKTPFLPCRSLLAGSLRRCPGHGPLEQTDSSEKCRAAFQKNSGSASKKDGGEKTVFP